MLAPKGKGQTDYRCQMSPPHSIRKRQACYPRGLLHTEQLISLTGVKSPSIRRSSMLQVLGDDRQAVEVLE